MTKLHKTLIATAAALAMGAAGFAFAANPMVGGGEMFPQKNIIDNAVNSKDHTTLVAAVKAAGLVETLQGPGPFTVFAPTNEAFAALEAAVQKHYGVITLPTMSTGATDMAYLRAKGIQSYGIGPLTDTEDGPKGFGAHSDQERILEAELHRFVRFYWDAVVSIARRQ